MPSGFERRKNQTRKTILSQSLACIKEQGYEAMTINSLHERLGGSKSPIYNYYRTKEDVLIGLVEQQSLVFDEMLVKYMEASNLPDYQEWLYSMAIGYREAMIASDMTLLMKHLPTEDSKNKKTTTFFLFMITHKPSQMMCDYCTKAFGVNIPPQIMNDFIRSISHGWLFQQWLGQPESNEDIRKAVKIVECDLEHLEDQKPLFTLA